MSGEHLALVATPSFWLTGSSQVCDVSLWLFFVCTHFPPAYLDVPSLEGLVALSLWTFPRALILVIFSYTLPPSEGLIHVTIWLYSNDSPPPSQNLPLSSKTAYLWHLRLSTSAPTITLSAYALWPKSILLSRFPTLLKCTVVALVI